MSSKGKKVAPAPKPLVAKSIAKPAGKKVQKKIIESFSVSHSHLFPAQKKCFKIGRDVLPKKRDLTRYVRWPRYVRLQRQRAVLKKRLKVPPAINQFTRTLDKNAATGLFRLLANYRPESADEKKKRRVAVAEAEVKQQQQKDTKPLFLKTGINHITELVENGKAKLVVIAHDVDPIEIVVWLPALCRKMNVPYCIVKSKSRIGHLVHQKTATAVALTEARKEDLPKLGQIVQSVRLQYNDDVSHRRKWGGGILGNKALAKNRKHEKTIAREAASKKK